MLTKNNITVKIGLILLIILATAGCRKAALHHNLNEKDANEILVILHEAGIEAEKDIVVNQNEASWTIRVVKDDLPHARKILVERNLPEERAGGVCNLFKNAGPFKMPSEERARFLCGREGDITDALKKIPEVIDAKVIVSIPELGVLGSEEKDKASASAILKLRTGGDGQSRITESGIKNFIANSIAGINPKDVTVIISYSDLQYSGAKSENRLVLWHSAHNIGSQSSIETAASEPEIDNSSYLTPRIKLYASIFFIILVVMSAALVVSVVRASRMRNRFKALTKRPQDLLPEKI